MSKSANDAIRGVTKEEVEHYREFGWARLPALVDSQYVAEALKAARDLMGEDGAQAQEREGVDFISKWWHDRHFLAREGHDPFKSLSYAPRMAENVRALIERDLPIRHYNDLLACKGPAKLGHKRTSWHQDYPASPFDRVGIMGFWLALNHIPPERGSMRFYSGSHKLGPLGLPAPVKEGEVRKSLFETYPYIEERCPLSPPLDMQPGDATCHHMFTIHSAPENQTDTPRWAYITTYFPTDTLYTGEAIHGHNVGGLEKGKPFEHPYYPVVA